MSHETMKCIIKKRDHEMQDEQNIERISETTKI